MICIVVQMEDIKLPFIQGKMDDIGDEEVKELIFNQ